jgi:predicted metal-binding protein
MGPDIQTARGDKTMKELRDYWETVCEGRPAEAKEIDPASVITAPWVRLKCQYGCAGYGRGYCCPPDTPTPEQTKAMLEHYHRAVLFHYAAAKREGENRRNTLSNSKVSFSKTVFTRPL